LNVRINSNIDLTRGGPRIRQHENHLDVGPDDFEPRAELDVEQSVRLAIGQICDL
jgi:hypothetical protein